jgi:hypothetical protein
MADGAEEKKPEEPGQEGDTNSWCDPFTETFNGTAEEMAKKARKMVVDAGGTFNGDASGGSFSVPVIESSKVVGKYAVSGQRLTVSISEKPALLFCSIIHAFVKARLP